MKEEHFDVVIVGSGICGISAAYSMQHDTKKKYVVLEARNDIGGTWDLFKYPGIRSDSDMFTFGFSFRPWTGERTIAPGEEIHNYLKDTLHECGMDRHVRCNQQVDRAEYSSAQTQWRLVTKDERVYTCGFVFMCTGYYRYDQGYTPDFPGMDRFRGQIKHPQQWTPDIDYEGKNVVVIGSGATAATIVPVMAQTAKKVAQLQLYPDTVTVRVVRGRPGLGLRLG